MPLGAFHLADFGNFENWNFNSLFLDLVLLHDWKLPTEKFTPETFIIFGCIVFCPMTENCPVINYREIYFLKRSLFLAVRSVLPHDWKLPLINYREIYSLKLSLHQSPKYHPTGTNTIPENWHQIPWLSFENNRVFL